MVKTKYNVPHTKYSYCQMYCGQTSVNLNFQVIISEYM